METRPLGDMRVTFDDELSMHNNKGRHVAVVCH